MKDFIVHESKESKTRTELFVPILLLLLLQNLCQIFAATSKLSPVFLLGTTNSRGGEGGVVLYFILEGTAAYGRLLLAPAEGWWPSATWRALRALFSFRCLEGLLPIIFKATEELHPFMDSGEP